MSSYHQCLSNIEFESDYQAVIFDVGCNINDIPAHCGVLDDFTEIFFSKHPNSKCYGFEPLHWQNYEKKWKNDSRVTLVKKALCDSIENKTLYIPFKAHAISSLFRRECFDESFGIDEVEVECTTLTDVCEEFELDKIDYLKVDTEGAEFLVIKGAKKLLEDKKINFIQLEYGGTYSDGGFTLDDIINYLANFKYIEIYRTDMEILFAHEGNI